MRICALVPDMMDRSRIAHAMPGIQFLTDPAASAGADLVVIDLARRADVLAVVRAHAPTARIVAFGPHVDEEAFETARRDGADRVLPRSRFFHDIVSALA